LFVEEAQKTEPLFCVLPPPREERWIGAPPKISASPRKNSHFYFFISVVFSIFASTKQTDMITTQIQTKDLILGTGNKLYIVTVVDTDDSEDSYSYLHSAHDEDHLFEQLKKKYVGDEDDYMSEEIVQQFEDDWGSTILFFEVGKISE